MADTPPSSTFLRFLREAMSDIGSGGASDVMRGVRTGADEFAMSPRGRGIIGGATAAGGMMGGYMAGANGAYQNDPNSEAMMGGAGGALAGGAAGLAGVGAYGGARGGARALRVALKRMLREGQQPAAAAGVPRPMELRRQLQQLREILDRLDPNDPRYPQVAMAAQALEQQLGQLGGA